MSNKNKQEQLDINNTTIAKKQFANEVTEHESASANINREYLSEEINDENIDIEFPRKNNDRAIRRKKDMSKAVRKRQICRKIYRYEWYDNLHQYSKNKIHCSCGMCRFRNAYESHVRTHSDMMRETRMESEENEYIAEISGKETK